MKRRVKAWVIRSCTPMKLWPFIGHFSVDRAAIRNGCPHCSVVPCVIEYDDGRKPAKKKVKK